MRSVYLDYAATTPLDPRVLEAMQPYLTGYQANPNSLHREGRAAFTALEGARRDVATLVGAKNPTEIVFNGGGTEGDVAALLGITAARSQGKHGQIIISSIEHHAVLESAHRLASTGYNVTSVAPRKDGVVYPEDLEAALTDDCLLVSIMSVNNEIGSIQPICELAQVAHDHGALFHTDGVQALGRLELDLEGSGVDAASFSTHKIYGPKGCGFMYLRRKTPFLTQMPGGGQEMGNRSGTQNLVGAVATAAALGIAQLERKDELERLTGLQNRMIDGMLASSDRVMLSVDPRVARKDYVPHITSITVAGEESETLILKLDQTGFEVSAASACSSRSLEPSHVLTVLGIPRDRAFSSLRISIGRFTQQDDIDDFVKAFANVVS